jgi:hypothetical protein
MVPRDLLSTDAPSPAIPRRCDPLSPFSVSFGSPGIQSVVVLARTTHPSGATYGFSVSIPPGWYPDGKSQRAPFGTSGVAGSDLGTILLVFYGCWKGVLGRLGRCSDLKRAGPPLPTISNPASHRRYRCKNMGSSLSYQSRRDGDFGAPPLSLVINMLAEQSRYRGRVRGSTLHTLPSEMSLSSA